MGVATVAWVSSAKHEKSCDGMGKATASHKTVGRLANSRGWRLVGSGGVTDAEYRLFVKSGKGVSVFRDSIIVPMYTKN